MTMKLLIILTFVLSFCKYGESQSCSLNYADAVRKCMQPFMAPNPSNIFLEGVFMDAVTSEQLNTSCRQRAEVDLCVKAASLCNNVWEVPEWIGLNDSLNYLCGEGRKDFEKFQTCTTSMKAAYESIFKLCVFGLPDYNHKNDPLESCRHTLGEFSCYVNASKLACDSEHFMIDYCTKLHQPMKARQSCKFDLNWNIKDLNMECNVPKAADCMSTFTQGQFKVFTDGSIMTTPINSSFLTEACKTLNNAKICMNYTGRCKDHELAEYWGIIKSLDYLCANKNALDKYQGCTSNGAQTFQQRVSNCQRTLPEINNNMVAGQVCRRQNSIYNCYVQAAKETCDSELMITTYYKKLLQPMQSLKDCLLDNTRTNASSYSQCDSSKLVSCISKIKTIEEQLMNSDYLPISPKLFQEYCMTAFDAHRCVQDQAMCTDMDRVSKLNWLDTKNAFNYICLENKNGFMEFQKCVIEKKKLMEEMFSRCTNDQMEQANDAVGMCRKWNDIQHCSVMTVEFLCLNGMFKKEYFFYQHKEALRANYSCELDLRASHANTPMSCGKALSRFLIAAYAILLFIY